MLLDMQNIPKPLIYLASASPRRSALLTQIGVSHEVRPVDIDESIASGETPASYVERLAAEKADALWQRLERAARRPVLGADTSVALGADVMGKPRDERDAAEMLRRLSGRTHQVYTAVALRHDGGCDTRLSVSEVSFRELDDAEIAAYWRTGEPADKAGAYAVQGLGAVFIERIAGSFSGIMGLPVFETGQLLRAIGWRLDGVTAP
jgi:septum formation protein